MKKKIIFITSFNASTFHKESLTKEWNDYRFDLWHKYTYQSIINQSYQNIEYWLFCKDELKDITEPYKRRITDPRVKIIYLSEIIPTIKKLEGFDFYILPRVDSDDLYHVNTAEVLMNTDIPLGKSFYMFTHGYALDIRTKQLKYWACGSSPFYAFIFDKNFNKLTEFWLHDHTKVHSQAEKLAYFRAFLVLIHGKNTSTTLEKTYAGREETDRAKKDEILKGFCVH